jgi:hypothetical protein
MGVGRRQREHVVLTIRQPFEAAQEQAALKSGIFQSPTSEVSRTVVEDQWRPACVIPQQSGRLPWPGWRPLEEHTRNI